MPNFVDMTGQRFGTWAVVGRAANKHGLAYWIAECRICGSHRDLAGRKLRLGEVAECCPVPPGECDQSGCSERAVSTNVPHCASHEREAVTRWLRTTSHSLAARGRAQGPPPPLEARRSRLAQRVKTLPR